MCVQKGAELTTPRPFLASTPKSGNSLFLLWREGVGMMEKKKWNECVTLDIQEKKKKKGLPRQDNKTDIMWGHKYTIQICYLDCSEITNAEGDLIIMVLLSVTPPPRNSSLFIACSV